MPHNQKVTQRITLSSTRLHPDSFHLDDISLDATPVAIASGHEVVVETLYLGLNAGMASRIGRERDGEGTIGVGDCPTSDAVVRVIAASESAADKGFGPGTVAFRQWHPWQRHAAVPVDDLVVLPDADPLLFATVLGHTGLTAWTSLELAGVNEDDHVLVSSAAGGVGTALVQWALARGARVTGIASGKRCEAVRALGAECIDRTQPYELPEFTVFHDAIGGQMLEEAIDAIAIGGRIMICGALDGSAPTNYRRIIHKDVTLRGFTVMHHLDRREEFWRQGLELVKEKKLRPLATVTRGLEHAGEAFCAMFDSSSPGRHVVQVS